MKIEGGRKTKTGAWSPTATCWKMCGPGPSHGQESAGMAGPGQIGAAPTPTRFPPTSMPRRPGAYVLRHGLHLNRAAGFHRPNLQNIPIRTEEGRRIRQAFIAPKGSKLISADYSQSSCACWPISPAIPELKRAFAENLDIHAMTASEIFRRAIKGMPADVRRKAKAINFGIVYGISGFGLANQLGIPQSEPAITSKSISPASPASATIWKRQAVRPHPRLCRNPVRAAHPYPRINSKIPGFRGGAERAAINAPIQSRRRCHPPRHGQAAGALAEAKIRPPCCCRCMTN